MARKIEVQLVGDDSDLRRAFSNSQTTGSKWAGRMKRIGKLAGLGLAAGIGVAIIAMKKSFDAAKEAELAQGRLRTQLKASGKSWSDHGKRIEDSIDSLSKLSAIDDELVSDSFTNILRVTGNVNKAMEGNALAADIARARGMDMAKAGELVGKVYGGNLGILSRYGIVLKDGATKQEAIAELQQKFGGQAEAYGKSAAGAQERFQVALENVEEQLGAKLFPVLTKLFEWGTQFMEWSQQNWPRFQEIIAKAVDAVRPTFEKLVNYWTGTLLPTIQSIVALARKFWDKFGADIKRNFSNMVDVIKHALLVVKGIINLVLAIIRGDWGEAWKALKSIAVNAMQGLLSFLKNMVGNILSIAKHIGGALKDGIVAGLRGLAELVGAAARAAINAVISAFNALGDFTIPVPMAPDIHVNFPDIPQVASGGHVGRTGLAVIHKGEDVIPANVGGAPRGKGRFLVLTDAEGVRFLQGLNAAHARSTGGRSIW